MAKVSLAQEPFDIPIRCGANALAAQGWFLVAVPPCVGLVALQAVVTIDKLASVYCFRTASEWVGPRVFPGWNMVPSRTGSCDSDQSSAQHKAEDQKETTGHCAPPFSLWNQLPTWFSSKARPTR
jgi:hypothetical protein